MLIYSQFGHRVCEITEGEARDALKQPHGAAHKKGSVFIAKPTS